MPPKLSEFNAAMKSSIGIDEITPAREDKTGIVDFATAGPLEHSLRRDFYAEIPRFLHTQKRMAIESRHVATQLPQTCIALKKDMAVCAPFPVDPHNSNVLIPREELHKELHKSSLYKGKANCDQLLGEGEVCAPSRAKAHLYMQDRAQVRLEMSARHEDSKARFRHPLRGHIKPSDTRPTRPKTWATESSSRCRAR